MNHDAIVEEILHFVCGCACKNVWSIATMDHYRPARLACPHCSIIKDVKYTDVPCDNIVKDTGTAKGRGVFAGRAYYAGELVETSPVIAFEGPVPDTVSKFCYNWPNGSAIALGQGTLFNHESKSNLSYKQFHDENVIRFYAARRIAKGEELTINYNSDGETEWADNNYFDYHQIKQI